MNDLNNTDNADPAGEPGDAELTKRQAMRGGWAMTRRWIAIRLTDAACELVTGRCGTGVLAGVAVVAWRTWAGG